MKNFEDFCKVCKNNDTDYCHVCCKVDDNIPTSFESNMNKIDSFKGKYFFLSNFFTADVEYNGIKFLNNEAAFQAQKCSKESMVSSFSSLNPSAAKAKGRKVILRHDWEDVKEQIMYEIVKNKFLQNLDLKERLIETGDSYLEEGNDWGDKTWGVCNGQGRNLLGKILMRVREELKDTK